MAHGNRWFSQLETSIYGRDFSMAMWNNQMVFLLSKSRFSHSLMISPLFMFFFPPEVTKGVQPLRSRPPPKFLLDVAVALKQATGFPAQLEVGTWAPNGICQLGSPWFHLGPCFRKLGRIPGKIVWHAFSKSRMPSTAPWRPWFFLASRDPHFGLKRRDPSRFWLDCMIEPFIFDKHDNHISKTPNAAAFPSRTYANLFIISSSRWEMMVETIVSRSISL